jgi:hypothetical protein
MVIEEILQVRSDGTTPLQIMMKDQYANYVIQKLLDVVNEQQREQLIVKIRYPPRTSHFASPSHN